MPANIVKPGQERYWQKAKALAEKEGRGGDWAYIVGIFKRMTVNKSMSAGEGLSKAVRGESRTYRVEGHPEVIDELDKLMLMMEYCGVAGCSRNIATSIDGDGPHWLKVEGAQGKLDKATQKKALDSSRGVNLWQVRKQGEALAKAMPTQLRYVIQTRVPGQVPDKRRMMELAEAFRSAQPSTTAQIEDSNKPMLSLRSVFEGLGLDPDAEASWRAMLGPTIEESPNELALRQAVYAVLRQQKVDGELGAEILRRALRYRRDRMQKSHVALVTVDELRKAGPAGGKYYRRVKGRSGRYRYYYDQDKYERSNDAHLDGETTSKRVVQGKVGAMLEKAGKAGVALADLKPLTKRYGSKLVGGVLNDARSRGELAFRKGRLSAQKVKKQ